MVIPPYQKGKLTIPNGTQMPYVSIGEGPIPFVVIPGAGDGLSTVDEAATSLAWFYRKRARQNRILVVSRRCAVPDGYTLEQHADDMIATIEQLSWRSCILGCNSGGGPIGQWIAVKRPDLLTGLILSCTFHRTTEHMRAVLGYWMKLAQERQWSQLNWSSIHYTFNKTEWRYLLLRPLLGWMGKPRSPERLERILAGILSVDNRPLLPRIALPTLVIGGEDDRLIGAQIQREMAQLIPTSRLKLYPGYGHGNDQENPDYAVQVERFAAQLYQ